MSDSDQKFTWVQTHKELAQYLSKMQEKQKELITLLAEMGVKRLIDEDPQGSKIELEEIDPFTFFCFINKYGNERRLSILQKVAEKLGIHYPKDVYGIPSAQAQKVMMFSFKYSRGETDINNLWDLFFSALNDSVTDEQFEQVLRQYGVGKVKITETLYYINPDKYFPINGPSKPYLEKVLGIDPSFETYSGYEKVLKQIRDISDHEFYELSYEARLWLDQQNNIDFEIWDSFIGNYKSFREEFDEYDERYKWEAIKHFQDTLDLSADDFASNFQDAISKQYNLLYQNSKSFITKAVEYFPDEVRNMFEELYDENEPLEDRIEDFVNKSVELEPKVSNKNGSELNHQQDERTISFYLAMKYPDRYPIYKNDIYQYLVSEITDEDAKPAGKKYDHYIEIGNRLLSTIKDDNELLEIVTRDLNKNCYQGDQKWLIFQDILWVNKRRFDSNTDTNYWVFQCNPKVYDVVSALNDGIINEWSVTSHIDKIEAGDKIILWVTGKQKGCYALGEVTSDVYESKDNETQQKYYVSERDNDVNKRVGLKITHDLSGNPITEAQIENVEELSDLNIGLQGTNFSATKEEYNALRRTAEVKLGQIKYWLYSPGSNAKFWDDFYEQEIMAIGWDELGDLNEYGSKDEIVKTLQEIHQTEASKKNDATANWEFLNTISQGDIIICKKGNSHYVGYGIVTSDYRFDEERDSYQSFRKVDWKSKGKWEDPRGNLVTKTLTDITPYPDYVARIKKIIGIGEVEMNEPKIREINYPLNTIFYGPPGTGKTYNTVKRAAEIVERRKIKDYVEAQEVFNENLGDTIEFITFHQNYSYEDFIQGLRPDTEHEKELTFERVDGVFKKLADRALKNLKDSRNPKTKKKSFERVFNKFIEPLVEGEVEEIEVEMKRVSFFITAVTNRSIEFRKASGGTAHTLSINTLRKMYEAESVLEIQGLTSYYQPLLSDLLELGKSPGEKEEVSRKNYVIIIDEINRANISRVFGELITLIEPDKRSEGAFALSTRLTSGEEFKVPSNLYIIGTMNTADKSIALLDIALRRRFDFEAMYPLYKIDGEVIHDDDILKKINERIIKLKGHDFQIGHSYFMKDDMTLQQRMNRKVIPLLLEYFMDDENEVRGILEYAGLNIVENSWPLRISGKK